MAYQMGSQTSPVIETYLWAPAGGAMFVPFSNKSFHRSANVAHVYSAPLWCVSAVLLFVVAVACELTLDEDTANAYIALSEDKKTATYVNQAQSYPEKPERIESEYSVLCAEPLSAGRSYWECEWSGKEYVCIGVAYKTMQRKESNAWVGGNDKSWSLYCKYNYYYIYHKYSYTTIPNPPPGTRRVGVYLDREAGKLAFYSIDDDTHKSNHGQDAWYTITDINFTDEDLYAVFWIGEGCSVTLI